VSFRETAIARPAAAVAAAGFMVIPVVGTDVITAYDRLLPSVAVSVAVLLLSFAKVSTNSLFYYLWGVLEPFLVVAAGWLAALVASGVADHISGDLRWLLPFVAGPAAAAAILTNSRFMLVRQRTAG
jgi:hypothetical protein